ncbi:endonuclease V [Hippea alviniae]|uniref:endonuclease V n=1 Tax=Hippea alviniae TaxID=1279027 RepID=UPI0003B2F318|nr:endonuclease V [Hippea alviniae]
MNIEKLKEFQINLSKRLNLKDRINPKEIRFVAGVDLTYTNIWTNPTIGIACIVVYDLEKEKEIEVVFETAKVFFPYIPTFLAFRELPLIRKASRRLTNKVDVFMLDGMGIIHPRKMGIAAHFGIVEDRVSIGVAKSHLTGEYKMPENFDRATTKLYVNSEFSGYVLRSKKNTKPIFVSPGNNISIESSLEITLKCLKKYKIPEPTRLAHNYLQQKRRELLNS